MGVARTGSEFVPRRPQRGSSGPFLGVGVPAPGRLRDGGLGQQRFWPGAAPSLTPSGRPCGPRAFVRGEGGGSV